LIDISFVIINIVASDGKYIYYHQHRGKEKTDIFSTCVFNNIVALTLFFYFPFFCRLKTQASCKSF